jgi:hypothetical protein
MRNRAPKRPKIHVEFPEAQVTESPQEERPKRNARQANRNIIKQNQRTALVVQGQDFTDDVLEGRIAFCCAVCKCTEENKARVAGDEYINADGTDDYPWHRRCCHGAFDSSEEWADPHSTAISLDKDEEDENEDYSILDIKAAYNEAGRQESEIYNNDGRVHPFHLPFTHDDYNLKIVQPYKDLVKRIESGYHEKQRCVVLDMFAGIGTGIVVLKRLGIDIAKVSA